MDKTTKKDKEDLKRWLLSFERHIGKDVVVSLLISKERINFISCIDRHRFLGEEEHDNEEPDIDLEHEKKHTARQSLNDKDTYFG